MDKAEQPTTQADIEAAEQWRFIECRRCSEYEGDFVHDLAADFALHRIAGQSASCDLGVGCDEAGVCYAKANGKPEMCHRTTSLAAQDGLVEALDDSTIDEIILNFAGGVVQVPSEHNPRGYVSYYRPREAMRKALSAIKEQHHD